MLVVLDVPVASVTYTVLAQASNQPWRIVVTAGVPRRQPHRRQA